MSFPLLPLPPHRSARRSPSRPSLTVSARLLISFFLILAAPLHTLLSPQCPPQLDARGKSPCNPTRTPFTSPTPHARNVSRVSPLPPQSSHGPSNTPGLAMPASTANDWAVNRLNRCHHLLKPMGGRVADDLAIASRIDPRRFRACTAISSAPPPRPRLTRLPFSNRGIHPSDNNRLLHSSSLPPLLRDPSGVGSPWPRPLFAPTGPPRRRLHRHPLTRPTPQS